MSASPEQSEDPGDEPVGPGSGLGFMRKPAVLGLAIFIVLLVGFRWARAPRKPPASSDLAPREVTLPDLPSTHAENKLGVFGARSKLASVLGKQNDGISTRARVMNVFRMKKSLVAVTEASVFIHATLADGLPEWVRPGKSVQLEGSITEVKTKTNIHVSATRLTSLN